MANKPADNRYKLHNELVNRTLIYLSSQQLGTFWSNPTGAAMSTKGHFHRFGLKGSSDIIGLSKTGRFIGIEIKTGKAMQSKHQKAFQAMVERNNGLYYVIREDSQLEVLALAIKNEYT
jgi:hypothetical protein